MSEHPASDGSARQTDPLGPHVRSQQQAGEALGTAPEGSASVPSAQPSERERRRPPASPDRQGPWISFAIALVKPLLLLFTKREWRGMENVPRTGGVILAANHLSWLDPFTFAHFVVDARRIPRFMAKESLFRARGIGMVLRGASQIPVHRGERDGAAALSDAVEALRDGEAVLIYPEGTITRDPDNWPMHARTGVARLALMSGAPIVPIVQWGAQEILARGGRRVRLLPRKTVHVRALAPVVVPRLAPGEAPTREQLRALTDEVMRRIRNELADIRREQAPEGIWDPKQSARVVSDKPDPQAGAA